MRGPRIGSLRARRPGKPRGPGPSWLLIALLAPAGCGGGGESIPLPPLPTPAAGDAEERNRRIAELVAAYPTDASDTWRRQEHVLGPNDLLRINVLEATELSGEVRVSGRGEVSVPLLGAVPAAGLTARELELSLEERLRESYIHDPHVTIEVTEVQSHPISVLGSVEAPGTFQMRGSPTLLEALAQAGGISADAGESVLLIRGRRGVAPTSDPEEAPEDPPSGGAVEWIDLGRLLETGDPRYNVLLGPGDVVKVESGGLIYVVGDLNEPGSFPVGGPGGLTVLQAVALAKGVRSTAASGSSRIVRTNDSGERLEIPVDLGQIIAGKAPDAVLQRNDIVYVPSSAAKSFFGGLADAMVRMFTFRAIW